MKAISTRRRDRDSSKDDTSSEGLLGVLPGNGNGTGNGSPAGKTKPSSSSRQISLIVFLSLLIIYLQFCQSKKIYAPADLTLSSQIPLSFNGTEDNETSTIDVVYVYCNKSSEIVYNDYQKVLNETEGMSQKEAGFKRSPPSKDATQDMDTMSLSIKMVSKMAKNLGTIFILVTHPEEVNDEITNMPNVKVIPSSLFYKKLHFSSNAAEAVMHKIPNLSKLYVAMNDDVIFTRPVDLRTFFFTSNGSPKAFYGNDPRIESWGHLQRRMPKTRAGGAHPQIKYTVKRLKYFRDMSLIKGRYPSHAPRPYHRGFMEYMEQLDPELFQSPFKTRFRCQQCMNAHTLTLLHSAEVGALRETTKYTLFAYLDTPGTWNQVVQKWDSVYFVTLQEVDPPLHDVVEDFINAKLQQPETKRFSSFALPRLLT